MILLKKVFAVILLIGITVLLCMIFDGSMDTIRITGYSPVGGSIWLQAEDGHIAVVGANNVIIVEDDEY